MRNQTQLFDTYDYRVLGIRPMKHKLLREKYPDKLMSLIRKHLTNTIRGKIPLSSVEINLQYTPNISREWVYDLKLGEHLTKLPTGVISKLWNLYAGGNPFSHIKIQEYVSSAFREESEKISKLKSEIECFRSIPFWNKEVERMERELKDLEDYSIPPSIIFSEIKSLPSVGNLNKFKTHNAPRIVDNKELYRTYCMWCNILNQPNVWEYEEEIPHFSQFVGNSSFYIPK